MKLNMSKKDNTLKGGIMTKNKMANAKMMTLAVWIMVIAVIIGIGGGFWFLTQDKATTAATTAAVTQATTTSLDGKPSTLGIKSVDAANDGAQIAALATVVHNPVLTDNDLTGSFVEQKTMSATTTTDFTTGINVGLKYRAVASNNSGFGFPTDERTVMTQADPLTLDTYTTTTDLNFYLEDQDGNQITDNGGARNLTLGANAAETLRVLRITQNVSNSAVNLAGFYFDKAPTTNITTSSPDEVGEKMASTVSGNVGFKKTSSVNLGRTEADDVVFLFDSPIILKEQESLTINNGLRFTADDGGCGGDSIIIYSLDKIWRLSSLNTNKMIYAYETDASTQADVGLTDQSYTFICTA